MSTLKNYGEKDVLTAARERIAYIFDHMPRVYVSFSGGKDSTVLMHLVMEEAVRRQRQVGVLIIDLEAQYAQTIDHIRDVVNLYAGYIDLHWVCLPIKLRNAVSNYQPTWCAWDPAAQAVWVRQPPDYAITDIFAYPFFEPWMEFEEFMVLWGAWYSAGDATGAFIGIRTDESLNRFRTIASRSKEMYEGQRFTTKVVENLFNAYPLYDWRTEDIWRYHAAYPTRPHNTVYDMMYRAGVKPSQMRLCQPFGDDQRKGLWLYHLLEPQTWFRLIARVNGVNSGALAVVETGNVSGYGRIVRPPGHTWKTFCHLLLSSLPAPTRAHYVARFRSFIRGWKGRGYDTIPDEAPKVLEDKHWAPSYRRLCKVLLRNDWWCKGLGLTQPKSIAYGKYMDFRAAQKLVERTGPKPCDRCGFENCTCGT